MRKIKNGFTLVELLAVIVILAIILVIAVPKVMTIIEDSKKATLETTAKMIANAAEKAKIQNEILGKTDKITCDDVAKMNKVDYESCEIEFDGNTAKVDIAGKNKFAGIYVCEGTKTLATATENSCGPEETPATCFTYEIVKTTNVTDVDACETVFSNVGLSEEESEFTCENGVYYVFMESNSGGTFMGMDITNLLETMDGEAVKQSGAFVSTDTIEITGYDINCGTDVVIPSKINDLEVTNIGKKAFNNSEITSVKFPNTIVSIGEDAFSHYLKKGIAYFGEGKLTGTIDLSKSTKLRFIDQYAFAGNQITEVYLPDSLVFLANRVFNINKINRIKLGKNLKSIGAYALYNNLLSTIEIPSKVTEIYSRAFDENPNLTKVINKTGKSFDWARILGDTISECTFETGTCGNIIVASN